MDLEILRTEINYMKALIGRTTDGDSNVFEEAIVYLMSALFMNKQSRESVAQMWSIAFCELAKADTVNGEDELAKLPNLLRFMDKVAMEFTIYDSGRLFCIKN